MINARFSGSKPGQWKRPFKRNKDGSSSLYRIIDRPCQIHGTPDKPANHTNRSCWVFKQVGKLNTEHTGKGSPSEDDDEEPRPPNTGGQKKFPPQVKMVNRIYATHIPKREHKRALRDVYAIEPVAQNSIHGRHARSPSIVGIIRPVSVMAIQPHWSLTQ